MSLMKEALLLNTGLFTTDRTLVRGSYAEI